MCCGGAAAERLPADASECREEWAKEKGPAARRFRSRPFALPWRVGRSAVHAPRRRPGGGLGPRAHERPAQEAARRRESLRASAPAPAPYHLPPRTRPLCLPLFRRPDRTPHPAACTALPARRRHLWSPNAAAFRRQSAWRHDVRWPGLPAGAVQLAHLCQGRAGGPGRPRRRAGHRGALGRRAWAAAAAAATAAAAAQGRRAAARAVLPARSPLTAHRSPLTARRSPFTARRSPLVAAHRRPPQHTHTHTQPRQFWSTWCGPCRQSIPHITALQRKHRAAGLRIVGVTSEQEVDKARGAPCPRRRRTRPAALAIHRGASRAAKRLHNR
jgi:thiol-disulfide isomerase/thioredoxin